MRGKTNNSYSKEFREEAVKLVVEKGYSAQKAARELCLPKTTLESWVKLHKAGKLGNVGNQKHPLSEAEQELERVKLELAYVKQQRDILKKAAAYLAKESQSDTQ